MEENIKQITQWNINHIIGTRVTVTKKSGTTFQSNTVSEATLLGGIVPVVWVDGIRGCYLLRDVVAVQSKFLDYLRFDEYDETTVVKRLVEMDENDFWWNQNF